MATLGELYNNIKTLINQSAYLKEEVTSLLNGKVDKVTGKGLSTNDYTTAEKNKLAGIGNNANSYVHPSTKQCDYSYSHPSNKQCNASIPSANTTAGNIKMNGTQSAGSSSQYAKADHVHPVDTSRAASSHNHSIGNITNLQSSLDGKAASSHNHSISNVTNLQSSLDGKASNSGNDSQFVDVTTQYFSTSLNMKLMRRNGFATFVLSGKMGSAAIPVEPFPIGIIQEGYKPLIRLEFTIKLYNNGNPNEAIASAAINPDGTVIIYGGLNSGCGMVGTVTYPVAGY